MQALQRRQTKPYHQPSFLPSPPSPHLTLADQLQQATLQNNESLYSQELLNSYLESQQASFAQPFIVGDELPSDPSQYMSSAFDLANPSIRIQQSTPQPQLTAYSQPPSMLSATNATASGLNNWGPFVAQNNGQLDHQSLHAPSPSRSSRTHQRAASSSSIGSNGSQYQPSGHGAGFSYVAHSENLPSSPASKLDSSYGADGASRAFSNQHNLPTPSQTPTQDSFGMNSNYSHYTPNVDSTMAAHLSMKQALLDSHGPDDDVPGFAHSARQSVSSYGHDSPATPHTNADDFEDRSFRVPPSDMRNTVPKFERTYTDAAIDELYNPSLAAQIPHSTPQNNRPTNSSLLSPYGTGNGNNAIKNALRAAESARSQSPASSAASRGVSPFRASYAGSNAFSSPPVRVGTAADLRERQKAEADAYAMRVPPSEEPQPKTISPKDALLDYHGEADDDSKGPLFPDGGASEYEHQYNGGDQYRNTAQSNFDTTSTQDYRRNNWSTPQFSPQFSASSGPSSQTSFSFAPPSIQGNLHGLSSYSPQQYRSMPAVSEPTPDFPAHLTSMESSASEAEPVNVGTSGEPLQRPIGTTADTGTYTCTYHGCTLRFETPQKLQKHKREGHRNANPASVSNGMTSAQLLERNSQAGPHKCERINPTTGKPCNTIFSRPYDLTRHEDTIHNARKQKVRCALCVEEKTFSRNDALTRHMRVVHPEVDFPGKHRRRGGNHD